MYENLGIDDKWLQKPTLQVYNAVFLNTKYSELGF